MLSINNPILEQTAKLFLSQVKQKYILKKAFLYGSYARHEEQNQSDMDIAVLIEDRKETHSDIAISMAAIAFDVMLETGILIDAVPFDDTDFQHPELYSNPSLIKNIQREGILL